MAGHNKWSQIKRKKAAEDEKRGKLFGKLGREIAVAAREGGGDPDFNPRLRLAIDNAKAANMPKDNIDTAILRGTGELPGTSYEDVTYEGYGPGGVAIFIEAVTDNHNRTLSDLRKLFERHGGNLGRDGTVAWNFDRVGQLLIDADRYDEVAALEAALEAGAEDLEQEDDVYVVTCAATDLHDVQGTLRDRGIEVKEAGFAMVPKTTVRVDGDDAGRLLELMEALEDHDDVQNVYSNLDIDEGTLAELAGVSR